MRIVALRLAYLWSLGSNLEARSANQCVEQGAQALGAAADGEAARMLCSFQLSRKLHVVYSDLHSVRFETGFALAISHLTLEEPE